MKKNHMKPQETVVDEDEDELGTEVGLGHGSDTGVGSDEIATGEEVFVKAEGAVKVESVDNLDEESALLK